MTARVIHLGPFSVDFRSGQFHKHGVRIKLQRQPLLVLEALLEKPGEVITRGGTNSATASGRMVYLSTTTKA